MESLANALGVFLGIIMLVVAPIVMVILAIIEIPMAIKRHREFRRILKNSKSWEDLSPEMLEYFKKYMKFP